jgi:hypothetical protein
MIIMCENVARSYGKVRRGYRCVRQAHGLLLTQKCERDPSKCDRLIYIRNPIHNVTINLFILSIYFAKRPTIQQVMSPRHASAAQ